MEQLNVPQVQTLLPLISTLNHTYPEQLTLHTIAVERPCTDCAYDPVTQQSANIYCTTCGGRGFTYANESITIPASIDYPDEFMYGYFPAGFALYGKIMVVIDALEIGEYQIDPQKIDYFTWLGSDYIMVKMEKGVLNGYLYEFDLYLEKKGIQGGE